MGHIEEACVDLLGKTGRGDDDVHPLICHMLDAGFVAEALCDRVLSAVLIRWLSAAFGLPHPSLKRWLAFWAACHDIGKATPAFQEQIGQKKHLQQQGYTFPGVRLRRPARHDLLTRHVLDDLFIAETAVWQISPDLADLLARVLGGHHGTFPRDDRIRGHGRDVGSGRWDDARLGLLTSLASAFGLEGLPRPRLHDDSGAAFMVMAGLVSVADWIASSESFFPHAGRHLDLAAYASDLPRRAAEALDRLRWRSWPAASEMQSFDGLFGFRPNALQQTMASISESLSQPSLVLVEAPMGMGKTEAALQLLNAARRRFGAGGGYVALPTQATSNQMFSRVGDFLSSLQDLPATELHLLHGQAMLNPAYAALLRRGSTEDAALESLAATEWFATRKRGLLSPFGVGTIDQALLAVLQTRHVFVRLFGLAGKTVILDEVHAYDTYMTSLLCDLVRWLAALRCTVVLLSATLPKEKRRAILTAYGEHNTEGNEPAYPRVTVTGEGHAASHHVPCPERKRIELKPVGREPASIVALLQEALAGGGCAACICNTVARSQELYLSINDALSGSGADTLLLHARFPQAWRSRREEEVINRFGKAAWSNGHRPRRAVVVATQVIEQSLDVDFDLMVTDMAPVDLVLQRSGRLHRHADSPDRPTKRPESMSEATLWLAMPEIAAATGLPELGPDEYVYERFVLLRSYLALVGSGRNEMLVPDDVEGLIESVYGDAPLPIPDEAWRAALKEAEREMLRCREHDEVIARSRTILPPCPALELLSAFNMELEEDSPEAHQSLQAATRLTRPSVTLICLERQGDRVAPVTSPEEELFDLGATVTGEQAGRLLGSAVSVSHQGIVHEALADPAPESWRRMPALRHCRPAVFDSGRMTIGRYVVTLDEALGLRIADPARDKED